MSDETFAKTLIGARDIPYADEDGYAIEQQVLPRQSRSKLLAKISTDGKGANRVTQISCTSRDFVDVNSVKERREGIDSRNDNARTSGQRYAYRERKEDNGRSISKTIEQLQRSTKVRSRQQYGREWQNQQQQQQQSSQGYSSSEESVIRNKSKSTSSADTQSVNNILDEYEDERFVESSDVGSTSTMNLKAPVMEQQQQQRRQLQQPQQYRQLHYQQQQQQVKQTISSVETRSSDTPLRRREKLEPVSKVNQQTQVRQRLRERQKESTRYRISPVSSSALGSTTRQQRASPGLILEPQTNSRTSEDLPRRGEVQRRVDEWLSQTQMQNHATPREKALTRSNSSAERRSSQRRCRQENPRSRSIDEPAERANGASSSSYDDLTRASLKLEDPVNVLNLNNNKGTYKDYLAIKGKTRQQDYGFLASNGGLLSRSRDISPNTSSRIPQRGSSFTSRRATESREKKEEKKVPTSSTSSGNAAYHLEGLLSMTSSTNSSSIVPRRPSFKRSFRHNDHRNTGETQACGAQSLVKEESRTRSSGGSGTGGAGGGGGGGGGGNVVETESKGQVAQDERRVAGEWIAPNKDGESRRCSAAAPPSGHDKPRQDVLVLCTSNDETRNADRLSKESREIVSSKESNSGEQADDETKGSLVQVRVPSQGQGDWRRIPARKPPILPRKDSLSHSSQAGQASMTSHESIQGTKSSFRPMDRNYAKSRPTTAVVKDNTTEFSTNSSSSTSASASSSCSPSEKNHVEKIYERSLEPQVIHADDLRSILRPALRISAYGERSDTCEPEDESRVSRKKRPGEEDAKEAEESEEEDEEEEEEEEIYGRIGETRHETLETIMEDDRKAESKTRVKDSPITKNDRWNDHRAIGDSVNDKTTMTTFRCDEKSREIRYRRYEAPLPIRKSKQEAKDDKESSTRRRSSNEGKTDPEELDEGAYDLDNRVDGRSDQQNSRFLNNIEDELAKFKIDEQTRCRTTRDEDRSSLSKENGDERQGVIIKESLLKNLQFEPTLPTKIERRSESTNQRVDHATGSRSKRFDDRLDLLEKTTEREEDKRKKEKTVYLSKEELEHRRLMDMLRRGDYDAVKLVSKVQSFFWNPEFRDVR